MLFKNSNVIFQKLKSPKQLEKKLVKIREAGKQKYFGKIGGGNGAKWCPS